MTSRRLQVPFLLAALAMPGALAGAAAEEHSGRPANRLAGESSPYLRLHAHNPVDWYPWGAEALARARAEDKPIFLSVGYSTCYWCHVMEREVFSEPEIAALMNEWFVNIKVDREERPDLDEIYMTATQLLTRHGGWPNSVFLTPALEPFYAGTYFPPEDRPGRIGFPSVLRGLHEAWVERRDEVETRAAEIAAALERVVAGGAAPAAAGGSVGDLASLEVVDRAVAQLEQRFDPEHGGFGGGPKFPSPGSLFLLWERGEAGESVARDMVLTTLRKMGRGAIYDQLDGGFHRYTLDAAWKTPHFEKMLYDNAHLLELLAVTAAATGDPELERLGRGTAEFILAEMTLDNGAFKSAIDAETDAVEGAFYIWTREEVQAVVDDDEYRLVAPLFGLDREPNFEGGHYTLFLTEPLAAYADRLELSRPELQRQLAQPLDKLRRARKRREFPRVDDKVLTDWNGMAVAAMARAGRLLDEPRYVAAAERAASFLLELGDDEGVQLHVWRAGEAKIRAFLDDYAFLIRGLLALDEATDDPRWLAAAKRLGDQLEARLAAPTGGYFMSEAAEDLLVRARSATEGAVPSGNGVAILNALELERRTGEPRWRTRATAAIGAFGRELREYPASAATVTLAVARLHTMASRTARDPGDAVVRASARRTGGGRARWSSFEVVLEIDAGWHVNANPATLDYLIPTRVTGGVRGLVYPRGERLELAFADDVLDVYSGRVVLAGEVAAGENEVELTYQACDDRRCLPPVKTAVELTENEE